MKMEREDMAGVKEHTDIGSWRKTNLLCAGGLDLRIAGFLLCFAAGCATSSPSMQVKAPPEMRTNPAPYAATVPTSVDSLPASRSATGSIWAANRGGSLFSDIKARSIGDVVTITVSEESQAANEANTLTNRSQNLSTNFSMPDPTFGGKSVLGGPTTFGYTGNFGNDFSGKGSTDRANSITAVMSATVVDILPNGNLMIRGSRWTKVNDELQQIILEGIIRPTDVTRNNTVLSQNIADARIFIAGKGPVSHYQKPGWLGQLLSLINPF